jgi:hypothetical protein
VRPTLLVAGLLVGAACQPNTGRPALSPLPESAGTEVRLAPAEATRKLAEALRADSVPVRKVLVRDAYLETDWFDAQTGRSRRPAPGFGVVRIRAWADPARPGSSLLAVETAYRALADPSLPDRELDRQVPAKHPVAVKVEAILQQMVKQFGGPPPPQTSPPAASPAAPGRPAPSDQ